MAKTFKPKAIQKKTKYHHGNLRASIIEAVARLIGEQKTLGFQLKEVAAIVGTSQPAIYKHFDGKHALLVETAVAGYDLQKKLRDYAIEQSAPNPLSKILAIGYAYIEFAQKYPGYFLLLKNFETDEILLSKRYQKQRNDTLELVRGLIQDCIDQDLFIEIDLDLAMTSLQAMVFGLAHLYIGDQMPIIARGLATEKDLVSRVFSINFTALLTPKGMKNYQSTNDNPFL